jgi:hypothetical protein
VPRAPSDNCCVPQKITGFIVPLGTEGVGATPHIDFSRLKGTRIIGSQRDSQTTCFSLALAGSLCPRRIAPPSTADEIWDGGLGCCPERATAHQQSTQASDDGTSEASEASSWGRRSDRAVGSFHNLPGPGQPRNQRRSSWSERSDVTGNKERLRANRKGPEGADLEDEARWPRPWAAPQEKIYTR